MYGDVNVKQVENKLANIRVQMSKVVENFKVNGNGDDNCVDPEEEWIERTVVNQIYGSFDCTMYINDHWA